MSDHASSPGCERTHVEPCPVIVGQQHGPGPGLFITCGKPHTVAEHTDEPTQSDEQVSTDSAS